MLFERLLKKQDPEQIEHRTHQKQEGVARAAETLESIILDFDAVVGFPRTANRLQHKQLFEYEGHTYRVTPHRRKSVPFSQELVVEDMDELEHPLYVDDELLLFLSCALNNMSEEQQKALINECLEWKRKCPTDTRMRHHMMAEAIADMAPLEGERVVEFGGKRLDPTARALGAEVLSIDSSIALTRFSPDTVEAHREIEFALSIDGAADALSMLTNLTKIGGFSLHFTSDRSVLGTLLHNNPQFMEFLGWNCIQRFERWESGDMSYFLFVKEEILPKYLDMSFLVRTVDSNGELRASLLKRSLNGSIYEEPLPHMTYEEAIEHFRGDSQRGIPLEHTSHKLPNGLGAIWAGIPGQQDKN